MKKIFAVFLLLMAALSGCYYDNYDELYPAASLTNLCDTISAVTYNHQISSLLTSYCTGCHSASIVNGNIRLDSYSGAMSAAESGQMLGALLGQGSNPQMPPNTKLDACSIRQVQLWIQNNYAQ